MSFSLHPRGHAEAAQTVNRKGFPVLSLRMVARWLALVLVPVVVVTWPGSAQAVDFGGSASGTIELLGGPGQHTLKSNFRYVKDGNAQGVEMYGGICQGPMGGKCNQGDTFQTSFRGEDTEGNPCTVGGVGTFTNHPDDTWHSELVYLGRYTFMPALGAGCTFTSWCVDIDGSQNGQGCTDIVLPEVNAAPADACAYGTPTGVEYTREGGNYNSSFTFSPDTPAGQQWDVVWYNFDGTGAVGNNMYSTIGGTPITKTNNTRTDNFGWNYGHPEGHWGEPAAVLVMSRQQLSPDGQTQFYRGNTNLLVVDGGVKGATSPGNCLYWFGPDIGVGEIPGHPGGAVESDPWAELGGSVEPVEELPDQTADPVEDEGSNCDFSWTDPTTWASGGICALVAAVLELIDVVGGIVAAVIDGLELLLNRLFMPHPDTWGWDSMIAQAETRPPASVVGDIADSAEAMAAGYSGSGCGVLDSVTIEGHAAEYDCQAIKQTPNFGALYALTQLALWAMTGLGLWKMFSGLLEQGN